MLRPSGWSIDIYEGRLAVHERFDWSRWWWATLRPGWLALAWFIEPNQHFAFLPRRSLAAALAANRSHPDALFCDHAIKEGVLALEAPMEREEMRRLDSLRFGRVGVARAPSPGFLYNRPVTTEEAILRDRDDLNRADRHRGMKVLAFISPATPPGMRVRTGRFVGLRLRGKPRNAKLVEERVG